MSSENSIAQTEVGVDELARLRRRQLAIAIYDSLKEPGDPPYEQLSEWEQRDFEREARGTQRRMESSAKHVAVELMAQAYALAQGWTWPQLEGCLPASLETPIDVFRAERRQKLRFLARQMAHAYEWHLTMGGVDDHPEMEEQVVKDIRAQREQDEQTVRKFKPTISVPSLVRWPAKEHGEL